MKGLGRTQKRSRPECLEVFGGQLLRQPVGDGLRAECCKRAEAGWFSPRSWTI